MSLIEDYDNQKKLYRKIFAQCLNEAQEVDNIESVWVPEIRLLLDEILRERKQYSCNGCGTCCRFAVSEFSPEQLKIKADSGDNYAAQFLKTFVPYDTQEEARSIYPEYVDFLENNGDGDYYFYHCPKITEDNRCPDYENRPQICRDFPDVTSLFLPKPCAFTAWKLKSLPVWLKLNAQMEILDYIKANLKD